jgi:hypothetical protein
MARRQCSENYIVHMLDECDLSDLEDVFSECDDEFIPHGDASESEDNLEVNSEESDIAGATSDVDSDEDEFIAKSGSVEKFRAPGYSQSPV